MNKKIEFQIDYVDSLAQGIDKSQEKLTIIPGTLAGETGIAEVVHTKSKIQFAKVLELREKSDKRINPSCEHYKECGGCHFLHTTYEHESELKLNNLKFLFKYDEIEYLIAPKRDQYRNRVQLQYDKKKETIGFYDKFSNKIVHSPNCKIIDPRLRDDFEKIYQEDFLKNVKRPTGHIEIYLKNNHVKTQVNKEYAHGGFTQVFNQMNELAVSKIKELTEKVDQKTLVWDIFGGNGNLSSHLEDSRVEIFDATDESFIQCREFQKYNQVNLYEKNVIEKLKALKGPELLIVDPPRSGYKGLFELCDHFNIQNIIYLSCNPQTLKRDINPLLENYQITYFGALDFFPSTHHIEALVSLRKKQ